MDAKERLQLKVTRARLLAFLQGHLAGRQGLSLLACPYNLRTFLGYWWSKGWDTGTQTRHRQEDLHLIFCPCCNHQTK